MRPFWLKFGLKGFEEWIFRVIKWIVAPFHGNLPNLSNDPRNKTEYGEYALFHVQLQAQLERSNCVNFFFGF